MYAPLIFDSKFIPLNINFKTKNRNFSIKAYNRRESADRLCKSDHSSKKCLELNKFRRCNPYLTQINHEQYTQDAIVTSQS